MKLGDKIQVVSNGCADYGYMLNQIGTIVAGGNLVNSKRRWLVSFPTANVHVFERDMIKA